MCSQIARRLLGKILIDLRNTREEAISVAGLKSCQDDQSTVSTSGKDDIDLCKKKGKDDTDVHSKSSHRNEDSRRTSFTGEKPINQEDDDGKETEYRLDPK